MSHTESSGIHFIEIHQGTVGANLTIILVLGILLCFIRAARWHYLRRRHFRDTVSKKIRKWMWMQDLNQDQDQPQPHQERYQSYWDWDLHALLFPDCTNPELSPMLPHRSLALGSGNTRELRVNPPALMSTLFQIDLHHNLLWNIKNQTSRCGSRQQPRQPLNSPDMRHQAHQTSSTWERLSSGSIASSSSSKGPGF